MKWNVFLEDFNKREIVTYDVFGHASFAKDISKLKKKKLSREEFSESLRHIAMYYFWSKSEYEIIITSWPPHIDDEELKRISSEDGYRRHIVNLSVGDKVDVFRQLFINWDRFVDYVFGS